MNSERTVFAQVMDHLPLSEFRKSVRRYHGHYKVQKFSCLDQYLCMAFAQLTYRESLRDIESCLRAMKSKLYHMGIRAPVSRSTLAHANEKRDWRIYADFAQILIGIAKELYADEDLGLDLENTVYALDSSTIDLCLSLFPWAHFRKAKGAVKLHTLLNMRGNIPEFIYISDGKLHDVNVLDILIPEPGSFYVMDRAYLDYERLHTLHQQNAYFVTRAKKNARFRRLYSRPIEKSTGLRCDQTVVLTGFYVRKSYPDKLRRIHFLDPDTQKRFIFITNNFTLPALIITQLYKERWRVELFFKWIKQHLRIKVFYGHSMNAVQSQIWIAISVYVLVAIIKKRLGLEQSLYTILQILSVTIFEKMPILRVFREDSYRNDIGATGNQLTLFD